MLLLVCVSYVEEIHVTHELGVVKCHCYLLVETKVVRKLCLPHSLYQL